MSFLIRKVKKSDIEKLYDLSGQFTLLNLPADRKVLNEKIEKSLLSFSGECERKDSEYIFVMEDISTGNLVGSSQIIGQKGTPEWPNYAFRVLKRSRYSEDLGVGFTHTVLSLREDNDGPTEIGGLLVDRSYRNRKEKFGKQLSLVRFLYIAKHSNRFDQKFHVEFAPPFTEDGKSIFWEALGRKFTGLEYNEADLLSRHNKEFIHTLFPETDLYLTLLDPQVRLVLGEVGSETLPAQRMLENLGFEYSKEVDPFDGGPHYRAQREDLKIIDQVETFKVSLSENVNYQKKGLISFEDREGFKAIYSPFAIHEGKIHLPQESVEALSLEKDNLVSVLTLEL